MARVLWCIDGKEAVQSNVQPSREEIEKFLDTKLIDTGDKRTSGKEGTAYSTERWWDPVSELGKFFEVGVVYGVFKGWSGKRTQHPLVLAWFPHAKCLGHKVMLYQGFDLDIQTKVV